MGVITYPFTDYYHWSIPNKLLLTAPHIGEVFCQSTLRRPQYTSPKDQNKKLQRKSSTIFLRPSHGWNSDS